MRASDNPVDHRSPVTGDPPGCQETRPGTRGTSQRGDADRLRALLHPYLRWSQLPCPMIRGRPKVIAHLAAGPVPGEPEVCALRDGQVYRWTAARTVGGGGDA